MKTLTSYCLRPVLSAVLLLICAANNLDAQIVSPGELSEAHSFLEGLSKCTSCHELGKPRIINNKCLDCHTPVEVSILELKGYHGRDEVIKQNCANCHKEHFGRSFDVLHFDSTDFDHGITGFKLEDKHAEIGCSGCHGGKEYMIDTLLAAYRVRFDLPEEESTFMGLGSACVSCHEPDNVHGKQFSNKSCESCHTAGSWEEASAFDHREARFTLTGRHITVSCESCHKPVLFEDTLITQYMDIPFESCTGCHDDVHFGRLTAGGNTCETCHLTDGWHRFGDDFPESSFPHEETGYRLLGAHTELTCTGCHTARNDTDIKNRWAAGTEKYTYPAPESEECIDCHTDYHEGVFTDSGTENNCGSCHTVKSWYPSAFGLEAHNNRSRFELTGAHIATPCFSCHKPAGAAAKPLFHFEDVSCVSCHEGENPHGELTGLWEGSHSEDCASCHTADSWNMGIKFDHEVNTGFALTGKHSAATCSSCHFDAADPAEVLAELSFSRVSSECITCHEKDDPHRGQFDYSTIGPGCENCHTAESFLLDSFDHSRTSFPLDGAHINAACAGCHINETAADGSGFTRFYPLSSECSSCHEDQ